MYYIIQGPFGVNALARFGAGSLNIYSEAYTGGAF